LRLWSRGALKAFIYSFFLYYCLDSAYDNKSSNETRDKAKGRLFDSFHMSQAPKGLIIAMLRYELDAMYVTVNASSSISYAIFLSMVIHFTNPSL
jgi:hypothetical protein